LVTLSGTGFAAGAVVAFLVRGGGRSDADNTPHVVSATEIRTRVPDLHAGGAGELEATVSNPGEDATAPVILTVLAFPDVEPTYPLCTLTQFKSLLGVSLADTNSDERYMAFITAASSMIAAYCQRRFEILPVVDELHDGTGDDTLDLDIAPLVSLQSVQLDDQALDISRFALYTSRIRFKESGDYEPRLRGSAVFGRGAQNVRVSYTAGYARVPSDLSHAAALQAQALLNTHTKLGLISEVSPQANVNQAFGSADLLPMVKTICARYRRVNVETV
jgi:hypothetical protein